MKLIRILHDVQKDFSKRLDLYVEMNCFLFQKDIIFYYYFLVLNFCFVVYGKKNFSKLFKLFLNLIISEFLNVDWDI